MSEVRIPRKHKGEVLSQSSEHAKAVRRQPKRRTSIKGRREYDVHAERDQQNVSKALVTCAKTLLEALLFTVRGQGADMSHVCLA